MTVQDPDSDSGRASERLTAYERSASSAEQRAGRMLVVALVGMVAAVIVYFALGMPGMDHGGDENMRDMTTHVTKP